MASSDEDKRVSFFVESDANQYKKELPLNKQEAYFKHDNDSVLVVHGEVCVENLEWLQKTIIGESFQ